MGKIIAEKDEALKELSNIKYEFKEQSNKMETVESNLKTQKKEFEKMKAEHALSSQKLLSIESEHKGTVESLHNELEEVQLKLKEAQKKLDDSKEDCLQDVDTGLTGLDETAFGDDFSLPQDFSSSNLTDSFDKGPVNNITVRSENSKLMKLPSLVSAPPVDDSRFQQMSDQIALLTRSLEEANKKIDGLSKELSLVKAQQEDGDKALQKKLESKKSELEALCSQLTGGRFEFIEVMNDLNDDICLRDREIAKLKKQLRDNAVAIEESSSQMGQDDFKDADEKGAFMKGLKALFSDD